MTKPAETWANWAGNVIAAPSQVERPHYPDEIAEFVTQAAAQGRRVKPIGSGHSFTGIAATDGLQLRLDRFSGLIRIDPARHRVTVASGTLLADLNQLLQACGLAMENLGDIDQQTIAGALSTGTHGTGGRLAGLANQVSALELVLADGSRLHCSPDEHPDVFSAARVALGALGVLTEVTLQCVPAFRLRAVEAPSTLDAALDSFAEQVARHDHVEFYWFPHTNRTLTKSNDRVGDDHRGETLPHWRYLLDDELLSNGAFELANRIGTAHRNWIPRINQISSRALTERRYVGTSYEVFTSPRRVRFVESEYALPRTALEPALRALQRWIDDNDERIGFPVEIRVAAADDCWLSTGYQRDNVYIAVHQYHRLDHRRYFAAFEAIAAEHAGRPHWGKMHSLDATQLRPLYPRFDDFLQIRERLDPHRVFSNDYLDRILGP